MAEHAELQYGSATGNDLPAHEETYRNFGFELVSVEPGSLAERVSVIKAAIR